MGAGSMNTTLIVATQIGDFQPANFAAKLCADYSVTIGGVTYGDWYLPSIAELDLLYLQRIVVGGFDTGTYWSSTEIGDTFALYVDFSNGTGYFFFKADPRKVRAIRAF